MPSAKIEKSPGTAQLPLNATRQELQARTDIDDDLASWQKDLLDISLGV